MKMKKLVYKKLLNIFIDNINKNMILKEYLYTKLFKNLKHKANQILKYFYSNSLNKSKI